MSLCPRPESWARQTCLIEMDCLARAKVVLEFFLSLFTYFFIKICKSRTGNMFGCLVSAPPLRSRWLYDGVEQVMEAQASLHLDWTCSELVSAIASSRANVDVNGKWNQFAPQQSGCLVVDWKGYRPLRSIDARFAIRVRVIPSP